MRLLTRHIHRAFVELDSYGDEQCWRFIRSAHGGWRMQVGFAAGSMGVGIAMTLVGVVGWAFALDGLGVYEAEHLGGAWWRWILGLLAALPTLGLGPVAGYFMRDRLLGWRLRYILRRRGRCPLCGYSLIGLALSAQSTVLCPECGAECEVDPSMGELTREGAATGRVLSRGTFTRPPLVPGWVWRWLRRAAWAVGILVFVVAPAVVGGWELAIRRDAARARADLPGLRAEAEALVRASGLRVAGGTDGRVGTREALAAAMEVADGVDRAWSEGHTGDDAWVPRLEAIYDTGNWSVPGGGTAEDAARILRLARELLGAYRAAGLDEKLAVLAGSVPEVPKGLDSALSGGGLLVGGSGFIGSTLDTYLSARAFDCLQDGGRGLVPLIELRLGLARAFCVSPAVADKYAGLHSEFEAHRLIVNLLALHPEAGVLAELKRILEQAEFDSRLGDMQAMTRIVSVHAVAAWFMDLDEVRKTVGSDLRHSVSLYDRRFSRVGWYTENRDLVREWMTVPAEVWGQDASERVWTPPVPPIYEPAIAIGNWFDPGQLLDEADGERVERRGVRLLLALEMYRAAAGRYPGALEELVPRQIAAIPVDPWSGRAFRYRRMDPYKERLAREFLLYSVGTNRVDDGGVEPKVPLTSYPWNRSTAPGTDWIINWPR